VFLGCLGLVWRGNRLGGRFAARCVLVSVSGRERDLFWRFCHSYMALVVETTNESTRSLSLVTYPYQVQAVISQQKFAISMRLSRKREIQRGERNDNV
jgi:hypothetical protein